MTPSNPSEPNPDTKAVELFDEMLSVSSELLTASTALDTARVEQLIIKRGLVLEKVSRMKLNTLPPKIQDDLRRKLAVYADLEPQIEKSLAECKAGLAEQLKAYKEGKALINKYKLSLKDEPPQTRSRDA